MTAEFDAFVESYGQVVGQSIAFSGQDHQFFLRRKVEHLLELAGRRLGDPAALRVLDVGCGVGAMHPLIGGSFRELHGVDVSHDAIRFAADRHRDVRYRSYDGRALPFGDGAFDLVFASCVVHHVPPASRPAFMDEMRRATRPRGLVVVFEHNPLNPLTRLAVSRCPFDEDAVLIGPRATAALARKVGLGELERRAIIFFPFDRPRVRAVEHALRRLPLGAQHYVAGRR